jgi:hypothetical protein
MNVEQMQNHIASLCEANEIVYQFNDGKEPDAAWGSYYLREIEIPPITDECSYATALHEVGHILGRYQLSEVILVRERWAWKWAKRSALDWTGAMERRAGRSLKYYEWNPRARSGMQFEQISPDDSQLAVGESFSGG